MYIFQCCWLERFCLHIHIRKQFHVYIYIYFDKSIYMQYKSLVWIHVIYLYTNTYVDSVCMYIYISRAEEQIQCCQPTRDWSKAPKMTRWHGHFLRLSTDIFCISLVVECKGVAVWSSHMPCSKHSRVLFSHCKCIWQDMPEYWSPHFCCVLCGMCCTSSCQWEHVNTSTCM